MEEINYFRHATDNRYLLDQLVKSHKGIGAILNTIDKMYVDRIISKEKHRKLTTLLYKKFENKNPINSVQKNILQIATPFFFVFGIFLLLGQSSITGNVVNIGQEFSGGSIIGISLIFISFLLLYFLKKF